MQSKKSSITGSWIFGFLILSIVLIICSFVAGSTQEQKQPAVHRETKMDSLERVAIAFNSKVNVLEARVNSAEEKVKKNDGRPKEIQALVSAIVNRPPKVVYKDRPVPSGPEDPDTVTKIVDRGPENMPDEPAQIEKRRHGFFTFNWLLNIFRSKDKKR